MFKVGDRVVWRGTSVRADNGAEVIDILQAGCLDIVPDGVMGYITVHESELVKLA